MSIFKWSIDRYGRNGAYWTTDRGIVFADNQEDAENKVWELEGNDNSCNLEVEKITMDEVMKYNGVIEI